MIKNSLKLWILLLMVSGLNACTQNTPSMMNTSPVQVSQTTLMEQIPLNNLNDQIIEALAHHYNQNGVSDLDLTMTYNPTSSSFTAMNAVHELGHIKAALQKKNITNVMTQTLAVSNGSPSLIISYDVMQAAAPHDCTSMPGLERDDTTRFLGDYKFGCSIETMLSKQIARPSDLQGNAGLGQRDGRRDAVILDPYSGGQPREALEGIERDDLTTN